MRRSLGLFFLGLILGGFGGYALHRSAGHEESGRVSARSRAQNAARGGTDARSIEKRRKEDEKILLGDITTVPFQEVYEILSRQGNAEVARLALQLDGLPASPQTSAKIRTFFKAWAQLDPTAAFATARTFHTPETRDTAIGSTIAGADPGAAGALAKAIADLPNEALPESKKSLLFGEAVQKWSEVDPAAAAHLLGETKLGGMGFTMASYSVAQNWAARDPAAALAWAQAQRPMAFGMNPVNGVVQGWWKKDPAAAEAFALAQIGTPLGKQLVPSLASQMAAQDRAKATAWASKITDQELRNQAYTVLASQFSFTDPKAASAWALTLPPEAVSGAVESAVSMWAQSDPSGAAHWIEGLTGTARDSAVSSYSSATAETDPAAATAWAATIADDTKRTSALRRTTSQWLDRDPAAARAWIASSSLGENVKTSLLSSPTPAP
ncbi:MAG: hypothetical protein ABI787_02490 [Spartobacteria bacterium]